MTVNYILNEKVTIVLLSVGLIKKTNTNELIFRKKSES